jgi:glyoxylase-like metal-dependent hydrolase (beta-lactamase superfamily II)
VHHVSFLDLESRIAFVGDVAGVYTGGGYVRPPTPPPDIDVDAWLASVARIRAWAPEALFVTHFGPSTHVGAHLSSVEVNLRAMADLVRRSLEEPGEDADRAARFADYVSAQLAAHLTPDDIAPHRIGAPYEVSWWGLARYWRTRGARA